MILTVGGKIVYPCQGPCLVGPVVKKIIDDRPVMFYQLIVLNDGGGELFVPVDKADSIGIRLLLEKPEIPKLLNHLKKSSIAGDTWRQRIANNQRLFASGSAFDLAEIVETLTRLSETKDLSFAECKSLERARRLLVCEISEVMGMTKVEAEQQVNIALEAREEEVRSALIEEAKPRAVIEKSLTNAWNQNSYFKKMRSSKAQRAGAQSS
jgi:RNA polymerase-interacting CarD/CdnL/TRCF family regulator